MSVTILDLMHFAPHFRAVQRDSDLILWGGGTGEYRWRGVGYLLLVYLGSILLAALLTPPLYNGIQLWADASGGELLEYLAHHPFPRYFDRVRMLGVILGMIWLMRRTHMWSLRRLGFRSAHSRKETFTAWFIFGIAMLVPVLVIQALVGVVSWQGGFSVGDVLMVILSSMLSALVVAFLEEAIFRGVVFRLFYTAVMPSIAVVLSSLFFAMVHFKHVPWDRAREVGFAEGLEVAGLILASPFRTVSLLECTAYFLAGVILCLVFMQTRTLTACAGLHAGWVVTRLSYSRLVENTSETPSALWGGSFVIDGVLPILVLLAVTVLLVRHARKTPARS